MYTLFILIVMICDAHTHFEKVEKKIDCIIDISDNSLRASTVKMFSFGIHPKFIDEDSNQKLELLQNLSKLENCVAIGECGVDRTSKVDFSTQEGFFRQQISIANEVSKPLIIHCVRSYYDVIRILKQEKNKVNVVFHSYNGNEQITKQLLKSENIMFSFSPKLCFSKNFNVVKMIDNDRILIESDCENIDYKKLIFQIAQIKNILNCEEMENMIYKNFLKLIGNKKSELLS